MKAFKIFDEMKYLVQLRYGIPSSEINRISFSGKWNGQYVPKIICVKDKFIELYEEIQVKCRKCDECRLGYAKEWALKGICEFRYFNQCGCFITLTYDNEHLPSFDLADCAKDFQDFMKRLRKDFKGRYPTHNSEGEVIYPIRYLHCGEYGSLNGRPHHHAILFNFDFPDKKLRCVRNGYNVYYSESLLKLWSKRVWLGDYETVVKYYNGKKKTYKRKVYKYIPLGKCEIGTCTFNSISYVARYITKKVYGDDAYSHYGDNKPEYITMSRRPGIGRYWFDKYHWDMYTYDTYKTPDGRKHKPPSSFDKYFEKLYPDTFKEIKEYRKQMALQMQKDHLEQMRENEVRSYNAKNAIKKLPRNLNNGDEDYFYDERKLLENDSSFCI